jgi:hypothetical protein
VKFLFIDVPEVKIKVGQRGLPSIAQDHDIFYDRGTEMAVSVGQERKRRRNTNQNTLFPDPAIEPRDGQLPSHSEGQEQRTFSVHPQEGASRFPVIEYTALKKPLGGPAVMSFGCNVVIDRWIGGREPPQETISELVPCEAV